MISTKPQVTAVIVSYQSRDSISKALNPLSEAFHSGFTKVIVVDNNSTDGTADLIAESYPWVTLIRSEKNLGYGRGCNLGFKYVQTPYVLILNPDAEMDIKAIRTLVDFIDTNCQVGIAAPSIIEGESSVQAAGLMTTPFSLIKGACGLNQAMNQSRPVAPGGSPFRTTWVCGAIMLIRSELFKQLDGFDPRFFLYFEETDFCRRTTQAGFEIWAVGEAITRHIGGASAKNTGKSMTSSCIAEHYYPSRFYYLVKHFGWFRAIATETLVFALHHLRCWKHRISGRLESGQYLQGTYPLFRFPKLPDRDVK